MKGLLDCVEKLESELAKTEDEDALRLLQIRLAILYDKAAKAARATRTCPGPYWREKHQQEEEEKDDDDETSKKRPRRKRRQEECSPRFTKEYMGPPRTTGTDTRQLLCDACGQMWARDKKKQ
jgi:hypothetical protein